MRINRILLTVLLLSLLYSCESEKDILENNNSGAIHFSSKIQKNSLQTKASDSSWEENDKIGLFVKTTGLSLSDQSITGIYSNIIYRTSGNGIFTPESESQTIYFPEDNSKVDVIAYYPYQDNVNGYIYKVNVTNQGMLKNIDLLYSDNITEASISSPSNSLQFSHQLSKINLNISVSNNIPDLDGLQVSVSGLKTLADFNLSNGTLSVDDTSVKNINFKTTTNTKTALAEAILIPDNGGTGRIINFYLPGAGSFKWEIPAEIKFEKGGKYTYSITLNAEGITIDTDYEGWVETPLMKNLPTNATYIAHMIPGNTQIRNYSMLYDTKYKLAYWVAYPMHPYYLGDSGRTNDWGYDPVINQAFQALLSSGYGINGIDRGHQIPSADRTINKATNATTFYYTNMTPQSSTLNQNMWANLENKIRTWTQTCDTLYVVTGAMVATGGDITVNYVNDNRGQKVAKPKYYYKALAKRRNDTYYTIAFKMDNVSYNGGENYNNYRMTVKELEQITGFTLFPSIPAATKANIVTSQWN